MNKNPALYIHVPFCLHICHYCDFCHMGYRRATALRWLAALQKEMAQRLTFMPCTIYIGGGTPTALEPDLLAEFLQLLHPYMGENECTIEINPETFSLEKARLLQRYGVNRASIGVQSSNARELCFLGRHHDFAQVKTCLHQLQEVGITNCSLDILYSFPGQSFASFRQTLKDILSLDQNHISLYSLTVEKNTLFGKRGYQSFGEDQEADFYEYAVTTLQKHGYEQYEVANFSRPGFRSQHNQVYWRYEDFLGLSLGASSKINHVRSDNTRCLTAYERGEYIAKEIPLSHEEEEFEFLMMNLRLKEGFLLEDFQQRFGEIFTQKYAVALQEGIKRNWLFLQAGRLKVVNREILNSVLLLFMQ